MIATRLLKPSTNRLKPTSKERDREEMSDNETKAVGQMKCRLCGKGVFETGGYLGRVNALGEIGIWECRPTCGADLTQETKLLLAIEGE